MTTKADAPHGVTAPVQYGSRLAGVGVYLFHGQFLSKSRTVQAVGFLKDKIYWQPIDEDMKKALPELTKLRPGQVSIASRDYRGAERQSLFINFFNG